MTNVKTIDYCSVEKTYKVEYPKAYVAKIIESQNEYTSTNGLSNKMVKEIYVEDNLVAELLPNLMLRAVPFKIIEKIFKKQSHDPYIDRHAPTESSITDSQHKPYWVTDSTMGDVKINYIT